MDLGATGVIVKPSKCLPLIDLLRGKKVWGGDTIFWYYGALFYSS